MKLHSNPASPYGRKVKVCAHETSLFDRLAIHNLATSAVGPDLGLVADNPLAKIPCLVLEDGGALYDSRVICEYLDTLHSGPRLFPAGGAERWTAWIDGQLDKVRRGLDRLEAVDAPGFDRRLDIGTITVGCALGYLDFRFAAIDWRSGRPILAAWYEDFAARPSMQATAPA